MNAPLRGPHPTRPRPLFIFGSGRSGTSLLSRMLDAHPAIAIPYESHLYNRILPRLRPGADLGDPRVRARILGEVLRTHDLEHWSPRPRLEDALEAVRRPDFHGLVEALFQSWVQDKGKSRWGEKTPHHTLWWRTIHEGFPDLQVLHMVRDGRDVAISYRQAPFGPKHVYHAARHWCRYVDAAEDAREALGPGAFLQVRYEDLVADPEAELRRICGFLGEPYDPVMLHFHHNDATYPTDRRNADRLRQPVRADSLERWRTALSRRDLRIFEALAGDRLERYGYARAVRPATIAAWEELSCRFLEHPPRRLAAMLRNRRGYEFALESLRLRLVLRYGL